MTADMRRVLVVSHTAREEAITATVEVLGALQTAGVQGVMVEEDLEAFRPHIGDLSVAVLETDDVGQAITPLEVALVLGGDGTILRTAEIVRASATPIVGVNLGHVGFLAEMERTGLQHTIDRVLVGDYQVEERLTIDVRAELNGEEIARTWALNEASIEKQRRMIEVAIGIDGLPVSSFACDGVVLATPTGSTAYAFSAGGPIVWPTVQAMLLVPIAAHALFDRPLVTSPDAEISVYVVPENRQAAELWCDGRRHSELPPGATVTVRRAAQGVRLARLNESPFSGRLVRKFHLPAASWRGLAAGFDPDARPATTRTDAAVEPVSPQVDE